VPRGSAAVLADQHWLLHAQIRPCDASAGLRADRESTMCGIVPERPPSREPRGLAFIQETEPCPRAGGWRQRSTRRSIVIVLPLMGRVEPPANGAPRRSPPTAARQKGKRTHTSGSRKRVKMRGKRNLDAWRRCGGRGRARRRACAISELSRGKFVGQRCRDAKAVVERQSLSRPVGASRVGIARQCAVFWI
jgi:hypothetical protein